MNYMLVEKVRLIRSLVFTRLFFPGAKIVRFPSVFKGRSFLKFGKGLTVGYNCRVDVVSNVDDLESVIEIGSNVQLNDNVHIAGGKKVCIGDNVMIASRVFITDHNHGSFPCEQEFNLPVAERKLSFNAVVIQDNVWLGEGVSIMPGVNIGKNSIIGAGSVVTKSIPKDSIAVGNPAKVIKEFCCKSSSWRNVV